MELIPRSRPVRDEHSTPVRPDSVQMAAGHMCLHVRGLKKLHGAEVLEEAQMTGTCLTPPGGPWLACG